MPRLRSTKQPNSYDKEANTAKQHLTLYGPGMQTASSQLLIGRLLRSECSLTRCGDVYRNDVQLYTQTVQFWRVAQSLESSQPF